MSNDLSHHPKATTDTLSAEWAAPLHPDDRTPDACVLMAIGQMTPDALTMEHNRTVSRPDLPARTALPTQPPWALQQFFNGEIDLDVELAKRYPTMPMMSLVQQRVLGSNSGRRVCTLTAQDGSAALILDADPATQVVQFSFTLGSMITLRFTLESLSDADQKRWLELMRREQGGLAFLWGQARWENDYLICVSRRNHTNIFAFSPHNFDAGIRLTPPVTHQLLDWLQAVWTPHTPDVDDSAPLLTW